MPYLPEDEETTQEQGQEQAESGDISVSGAPSATIQAATPSSSNQAQKGTTAGQRLGNLKRMIEANQNPQIASKIGENLGQKEKSLESQLVGENQQGGLREEFRQKTDAERQRLAQANPLSQQFTQWTPEQIQQFQSGQMVYNPETQSLQSPGQGGVDYNAFKQAQSGQAQTYDIAELGDIRRKAEDLRNQAIQGETESGRFQLLRDVFAKDKQYTTGQQKVDELLLQQKGIDQLRDLAKTTGQSLIGDQGYIPQTEAEIEAARQAITGQASDIAGNIQAGTTGQFQTIKDAIAANYAQKESERVGLIDRINQAIKDNNLAALSPQDLQTLGIQDIVSPIAPDSNLNRGIGQQFEGTEAEIQKAQEDIIKRGLVTGLPGVELEKYFRDLNKDIPLGEAEALSRFATPEQLAKINALENLTNIQADYAYNQELAGQGFGDYAPDVLKQTLQADTTGVVKQKINELRDSRPTDQGTTFGQFWTNNGNVDSVGNSHIEQLTRTMAPELNTPENNQLAAEALLYSRLPRQTDPETGKTTVSLPTTGAFREGFDENRLAKGREILDKLNEKSGGYFKVGNNYISDRFQHEAAKRAEVQARNQKLLKDLYGWMRS